jgi:hypothetical protein
MCIVFTNDTESNSVDRETLAGGEKNGGPTWVRQTALAGANCIAGEINVTRAEFRQGLSPKLQKLP